MAIIIATTLGLNTVSQARGYGHHDRFERGTPQHRFENHVDRRQAIQRGRIQDGIVGGDLSHRDTKRLIQDQRHITHMEQRFERDGCYNPWEKRKLERALNRSSHQIRRAKHNDDAWLHGHHQRSGHGWHHRQDVEPCAYGESDESYVYSSSPNTTVSAQTEGFSTSWSTFNQE